MHEVVRIAIARGSYADTSDLEASFGDRAEFVTIDLGGTTSETVEALQGCQALVVALHRLDRTLLGALAGTISVVGRSGIGLDSIDLDAAQEAGIAVIHQPDYGSREVATHALALIMAVHRRILESDRLARSGWHGRAAVGDIRALEQMRAGIVGAGRIGRHLIEMLRPLVGEILVFDPYASTMPDGVRRVTDLHDLLTECSIVSLHLPLTDATRDIIGASELEIIGSEGILVNVSRGGLVNEAALADALARGVIAGAGFDVLSQEPPASDHPLLAVPNIILTPHTAWYSLASEYRCKHWTIGDVIAYLTGGTLQGRLAVVPHREIKA